MKPLLILLLAIAPFQDIGVGSDYDRFKDERSSRITESLIPDKNGYVLFSLLAITKGPQLKRPETVAIAVTSHTEEWYFLKSDTTLRVIRDEKREELGEMDVVTSKVVQRGVVEQLLIRVPFNVAERLVNSKVLEIQVGRYEAKFSDEQLSRLKEWMDHFPATR